jgi:hypothetical protein
MTFGGVAYRVDKKNPTTLWGVVGCEIKVLDLRGIQN